MKTKLFKFIFGITLMALIAIVLAIIWPMPHLSPPESHDSILIRSINIIDVESGFIFENRDIFIVDNIIRDIDTTGVLKTHATSLIIDGNGKFIIPGLWDMHTHSTQLSEWLHHPLYIANGVTGIRDMSGQLNRIDSYWAGIKERLVWNEELSNNKRVTPRYVLQSSFQMDGAFSVPDGFPEYFKLQKSEDVDLLLRFYKNEKVDFIKVYDQIPSEIYKQLALQAPKYGLYLAGHKPIFVSLEEAVLLGQRSFEHGRVFYTESFPNADSLRTSDDWRKFASKSKESMIKDYNPEVAKRLMLLMKKHDTYWVPTLQTLKFEALAHESSFLQNQNLKYIPYVTKVLLWNLDANNNKKRNLSRDGENLSLDFFENAREQIKMANEIGVPIMTGTDVTDSYVFAGFSIHDELEELTKSGLSNLEALQSGTIVPAIFAKAEKNYGTIEIDKIADLIILEKNPLENISNSKSILGVIMNGLYYDKDKINQLKEFTRLISNSFHMNIKSLYSLVASPLMRVQFFAD